MPRSDAGPERGLCGRVAFTGGRNSDQEEDESMRRLRKTFAALGCVGVLTIGGQLASVAAPALQSPGALTFAPGGVLVAADPKAAALVAIPTGDRKAGAGKAIRVNGIDDKIAAALGTTVDAVRIIDLAVNPVSHRAYLSVARGRGGDATAVILRVDAEGDLEVVDVDGAKVTRVALPNPPEDRVVGQGRRARNQRQESITDIAYADGRVIVAGLSNEEFASTLRSIPFPFSAADQGASVEIYHGAHGRFETRSPIRTFVPYSIAGETHLLAAYTCTPLVKVPMAKLKAGAHVKGTTIAELGNRNRPLDMVVYSKEGKDWFLMANSSRGVMKISTGNLAGAAAITQRVGGGGTEGQSFETVEAWKNVYQLARLNADHALVVQGSESGSLSLESLPFP